MKQFFIGGMALFALSGCATILSPATERLNVSSNTNQPFTATVDGKRFRVPGTITVERDGEDKTILTNEEGCAQSTVIHKSVDPYFFGNVISGGVFGSSTDYGTGKMWDYDDNVTISCFE